MQWRETRDDVLYPAAAPPVLLSWKPAMPRAHVLNGFFFALWIAVCAASPEFLWQGFISLSHHFTWASAAAALLIGAILAFFVEPIVEGLRDLKSPDLHEHKSPAFAACTSLSFAVVAVCVHEAITGYVDAGHTNVQADQNLVYALSQALQWAVIPFAITVAWLGARSKLWITLPLTIMAVLVIFLTGRCFEWSTRDIMTTAIPCMVILAGGYVSVRRRWDRLTFRRCARVTAFMALGWLAVSGMLQVGLSVGHIGTFKVYEWTEFGVDFRFYVGWVLGLIVAPSLVREEQNPRTAAPDHTE